MLVSVADWPHHADATAGTLPCTSSFVIYFRKCGKHRGMLENEDVIGFSQLICKMFCSDFCRNDSKNADILMPNEKLRANCYSSEKVKRQHSSRSPRLHTTYNRPVDLACWHFKYGSLFFFRWDVSAIYPKWLTTACHFFFFGYFLCLEKRIMTELICFLFRSFKKIGQWPTNDRKRNRLQTPCNVHPWLKTIRIMNANC